MGIYDREYYRRQGPSFLGSLSAQGQVLRGLLIANAVAFVLQLLTKEPLFPNTGWFTEAFILDAEAVTQGQVWRLLSYAFLHDTSNWTHIVFNMLFLWWFGKEM